MKRPIRSWLLLVAAMLVVVSCSSSDNPTNVPPEQAVQSGMNSALNSTVVPLFTFYGTLGQLFAVPTPNLSPSGYACPDTSGWCSSGSASCSVGQSGLDFTFNQCQVITGDDPLMVNGGISAIPGSTIILTFNNMVINGSPAISGSGTINIASCTYTANIDTSNASISGSVTQCDADPYPTGDSLYIIVGNYGIYIVLDGSSTATATATDSSSGLPVAYCTINLAVDPLSSSCQAY